MHTACRIDDSADDLTIWMRDPLSVNLAEWWSGRWRMLDFEAIVTSADGRRNSARFVAGVKGRSAVTLLSNFETYSALLNAAPAPRYR